MITTPDTAWFAELTRLATEGPADDELDAARAFVEDAERAVLAAKALMRPRAVSPAKARIQRYPFKPKN